MAEKVESKPEEKKEEKPAPQDQLVVTKHAMKIGGKEIEYTVTAGTMVLKEEIADGRRKRRARSRVPRSSSWPTPGTAMAPGRSVP